MVNLSHSPAAQHAMTQPDRPPLAKSSGTLSADILREAAAIVEGNRNSTHGEKERSFEAIAGLYNAYLQSRKNPQAAISATDVAMLMVLHKIGRFGQGKPIRDHIVDLCGYGAIAGEIAGVQP